MQHWRPFYEKWSSARSRWTDRHPRQTFRSCSDHSPRIAGSMLRKRLTSPTWSLPEVAAGCDLASQLEGPDRDCLVSFEESLLLSEDAFTQRVAEEGLPTPHWDDALVGDVYISFVNRLLQSGMLTLSLGCRSQADIFFVRKKSGRLRMIVDGRQGNQRMRPPPKTSMPSAAAFSKLRLGQGEKPRVSTYDIQDCFYQFKIPKAFGELFGFKQIQANKLGVQEVDGRAVAPLDWVTPVCAVLPMGCSWALHFCQQAHVNIALRTGLGRHRLLFDKTPAPLWSDAEPAVSVYVDNGGILSTQRGKANTLRRQLERKLGEVALRTHEAEAETDDLEMVGMRLHDGRAAPTRKRA